MCIDTFRDHLIVNGHELARAAFQRNDAKPLSILKSQLHLDDKLLDALRILYF